MKRVLVTGVAGFLGSHVAEALIKQGYEVVGNDNLATGDLANVPVGVEYISSDLKNTEENLNITQNVDVVFHAAAAAYDGLSLFTPGLITENVYNNTVKLLTASLENGVDRFVYCSSMARYGNQEQVPFTESDQPAPCTPYGVAKHSSELVVQQLGTLNNMDWVICIPHNIYGPKQKYDDSFRNVVGIMMNRMLQGKQPIIYGDGNQRRCFSYIKDVVPVLTQLITSDSASRQIVNVGPDEEFVTLNQLAKEIANVLNFPIDPIYVQKRPNEVVAANCSADKARALFGYESRYSLSEGLMEMAQWIQDKGPRPFQYHLPLEYRGANLPLTWLEQMI